jgi:hypothetical protein
MASASRRKKGRRRTNPEMPVTYVVEIRDWEWDLSFGVDSMRHRDDPYSDYRHVALKGKLLHPTKIKAETAELTLLPDPRLNWEHRQKDEPQAVGSLQLYDGRFIGLLSIPSDALPPLLQMLIGDRLHYAVMTGDKLRYRHGRVRSFRLQTSMEEDDMPADE